MPIAASAKVCFRFGLPCFGCRPDAEARIPLLVLFSFHLHLLGDLVGARGPDGDQWPIL